MGEETTCRDSDGGASQAARVGSPRARYISSALVAAVACGVSTCALFPGWAVWRALSTTAVLAQIFAFPVLIGVVCAGVGCAGILYAWVQRAGVIACAGWCALAVAGAVMIAYPYGMPRDLPRSGGVAQRSLTVMTFNTGSNVERRDLERLIEEVEPDVLILPETSARDAKRASQAAGFRGSVVQSLESGMGSHSGTIAPTSMVVSAELGDVRAFTAPATTFGTVAVEFADPALPVIVGIHTAPPLPGLMDQWRDDLARIAEFGESSTRSMIIAGDFNATPRHGELAARERMIDSQEWCSRARMGTWPAHAPGILTTPIDHVLITADLAAGSCRVIPAGDSDHLAYIVEIAVA